MLILVMMWIVAPAGAQNGFSAATNEREFCAWVDATLRGDVAEWEGYPDGWKDYPDDLVTVDFFWFEDPAKLPVNDSAFREQARVYVLLYSPSQNALWLFIYRSLREWADANGNHMGTHDFCAVRIYRLGE